MKKIIIGAVLLLGTLRGIEGYAAELGDTGLDINLFQNVVGEGAFFDAVNGKTLSGAYTHVATYNETLNFDIGVYSVTDTGKGTGMLSFSLDAKRLAEKNKWVWNLPEQMHWNLRAGWDVFIPSSSPEGKKFRVGFAIGYDL